MTKIELFHRLRDLVQRARQVRAASDVIPREADALDHELTLMEAELAESINDYMADQYKKYNVRNNPQRPARTYAHTGTTAPYVSRWIAH